ncbi:MAG: hypothetical protein ACOVLC_02730 [Flavobacterium sp.]|jgi:hypothetical protein
MKFKFILSTLFLVAVHSAYAQDMIGNLLPQLDNGVLERNRLDKKKNENVTGTPFVNDKFVPADIKSAQGTMRVRYNTESDELEISYEEATFVLPKKPEYDLITFKSGELLQLLNYRDARNADVYGYLYNIYQGNKTTLYLKHRSVIIPEKQPQNSYEAATPPRYSRTDDEYYFNYKESIVSFPDSKKDLIALYPNNKQEIEDFLKTNKLKFKTEADLIKIAAFLETL